MLSFREVGSNGQARLIAQDSEGMHFVGNIRSVANQLLRTGDYDHLIEEVVQKEINKPGSAYLAEYEEISFSDLSIETAHELISCLVVSFQQENEIFYEEYAE